MRVTSILLLVAWGALAFGAVYPWGYGPLFAACAATGAMSMLRPGRAAQDLPLVASVCFLVAAIALQLVPLRADTLRWVSPETDAFLRQYLLGYPLSPSRHPLSIRPEGTIVAMIAVSSLSLFGLGVARSLTHQDTQRLIRGLSVLGVVLSLAGIVQKATWNGKIYGFWTPMEDSNSFGPFVNRNHYAGWMLMTLPVTAAYFCGCVARGMRNVRPGWRNRVLWFSSNDANETIWVGFAVIPMAIGLVMSMSRSGIVGLLTAILVSSTFVLRQLRGSRRVLVAVYLAGVPMLALAWTGFDTVAGRFAQGDHVSLLARVEAWQDAWSVAGRFPVVGIGLNTYGTAMLVFQTANPALHFTAAHNDYLQLLAEGGLLVGIPATMTLLTLIGMGRRTLRHTPTNSIDGWIRVGAATGLLAIACQEAIDFSLQIPGNAVLFIVLISMIIRPPAGLRRAEEHTLLKTRALADESLANRS